VIEKQPFFMVRGGTEVIHVSYRSAVVDAVLLSCSNFRKAKRLNDQLQVSADAPMPPEREPPCSVEAEQAIIGGLLLDNSAWSRVSDLVRENEFYRDDHRLIFKALSKLADNGRAFDVVTLQDVLATDGNLEGAGAPAYLSELFRTPPQSPTFPPMPALLASVRTCVIS
jgi:hypothetical protein